MYLSAINSLTSRRGEIPMLFHGICFRYKASRINTDQSLDLFTLTAALWVRGRIL